MLLTIYSHFCSVLTLGAFPRNPQQPISNLPAVAIYGVEMESNARQINLGCSVNDFAIEGLTADSGRPTAKRLLRSVMLVQYSSTQLCISTGTRRTRRDEEVDLGTKVKVSLSKDGMTKLLKDRCLSPLSIRLLFKALTGYSIVCDSRLRDMDRGGVCWVGMSIWAWPANKGVGLDNAFSKSCFCE